MIGIFAIIRWLITAYLCYCIAQEKGLNTAFWAVMGAIFGVFALVVVDLLPERRIR